MDAAQFGERTKGGRGTDADGHPISVASGSASGRREMRASRFVLTFGTAWEPGEIDAGKLPLCQDSGLLRAVA